jgi:twitching motility two-component system response regulator PilH
MESMITNGKPKLTGLKVLVIDDSKTIRRTAETLLTKEGCEVFTAVDGFDALSKIADHQPDTSCWALSKLTSANDGDTRMPLILIVDDSPTEVFVMQKALEKHGFKTAAAENGEEGVRKAKAMKPDLIFMDIVMPGVNGYQATRMLINDPETSLIPIIMVTTKGQETDRVWGLRQGAVDYLVKPVSAQALVEKAQAALAV